MNIPQEIQDLMPERKVVTQTDAFTGTGGARIGFNQALTEVEAVLPQIIALAEKRGAEREKEKINEAKNIIDETLNELRDYCEKNTQGYWYAFTNAKNKLEQTLTRPNHE
jgi:hypothetical protein